jgi:hypothetical protein
MQLLRKMIDQGATQNKILDYFRKEGYSENEILDEIIACERERESKSALAAPVVDPTKPLPEKPKSTTKELSDYDKNTMLEMWQRGENEDAIKAMFVMKGYERAYIVRELEDIKLNEQTGPKHVGVVRSYAPESPHTKIVENKEGGISKPFVFSLIILVLIGGILVGLWLFAPNLLDTEKWVMNNRVDQYIIVLPVKCPASDGARIEVALGEARQMIGRELFIKETNTSCGIVSLYTRTDLNTITCPGEFKKNMIYTIIGDNVHSTQFKCIDGDNTTSHTVVPINNLNLNFGV